MCSSARRACGGTRWGPASALQHVINQEEETVIKEERNETKWTQTTRPEGRKTHRHARPWATIKLTSGMIHYFFLCACNEVTREAGVLSHACGGRVKENSKISYSKQERAWKESHGAHRTSGWWLRKGQSSWPWCCPSPPWAPTPAGGATQARLEQKETGGPWGVQRLTWAAMPEFGSEVAAFLLTDVTDSVFLITSCHLWLS